MKRFVLVILLTIMVSCGKSQVIPLIKNESTGGVYKIACKVNGIPMDFIFDTGCYTVSISAVEAAFLFKQGLLLESDILDRDNYMGANGSVDSSTTILIRKLEIGEIILENVIGSVHDSGTSPLLFGQSAFEKLGPMFVDFENKQILILNKNNNK